MARRIHAITFESSTAISATGNSSGLEVTAYMEAVIYVSVTTLTGTTPTMDVTVEHSYDNTTFFTLSKFARITATGQYQKSISGFGKFTRISYTLGGTLPVFTTTIKGDFKS